MIELSARLEDATRDIINLREDSINQEECLLDTDFRLVNLELNLGFVEWQERGEGGMTVVIYPLLKKRIQRESYPNKEVMQQMLDTYYFVGRITDEQYRELSGMLEQATKA